jgi:hypothetical protein
VAPFRHAIGEGVGWFADPESDDIQPPEGFTLLQVVAREPTVENIGDGHLRARERAPELLGPAES